MLVATWNVNSVRTRLARLGAFLARWQPDVVCLQELKVTDDLFPMDEVKAAGYHAVVHGQKTYNGVGLVSKLPAEDVVRGFGDGEDDPQARFIGGTFAGVRVYSVYVPNGQEVDSPAYAYKLRWLERLRAFMAARHGAGDAYAIGGDYNIAPTDDDCYDPEGWREQVLCTERERAAYRALCDLGLTDSLRKLQPQGPGPYTWWDYRNLAFPKNLGLRIDHVLASAPLASRLQEVIVDRDERKSNKANKDDKPSDHAPVLVRFA